MQAAENKVENPAGAQPAAYANSNGAPSAVTRDIHGGDTASAPPPEKPRRGAGFLVILVVVVVFAGLLLLGLIPRLRLTPQLNRAAAEAKTEAPLVNVIRPTAPAAITKLDLPGSIQGADQAAINARATGYLSKWYVDIGDHVKAGQVLALIQTPDTDQEVAQARAQVANSGATVEQSRANTLMQVANTDQAVANVSKAQAALQQAKSDLVHSQAAVVQVQQAASQQQAQVRLAKASLDLAKIQSDRYQSLFTQGAVAQETSQQQTSAYKTSQANYEAQESSYESAVANVSEAKAAVLSSHANVKSAQDSVYAAQAAVTAARANVLASEAGTGAAAATNTANVANLRRNSILQSFQRVTAPFDGIITARNAEVGALVSATGSLTATVPDASNAGSTTSSGGGSANSLFTMVRTGTVRIFVSLPQNFVDIVHVGQKVNVTVTELGSKPFAGIVARDASVLDPSSRTLLTEIDVPNPKGLLRPGMFATASLQVVAQNNGIWHIPDTALITDASGTHVAEVTEGNKLHFQPVVVGRDYGKEMEITSGLSEDVTLVANPIASLQEGMKVRPVVAKPDKTASSGSQQPGATSDKPPAKFGPAGNSPSGGEAAKKPG